MYIECSLQVTEVEPNPDKIILHLKLSHLLSFLRLCCDFCYLLHAPQTFARPIFFALAELTHYVSMPALGLAPIVISDLIV